MSVPSSSLKIHEIVNLTPHAIRVIVGGKTTTFEPSGRVARMRIKEQNQIGEIWYPRDTVTIPLYTAQEFNEVDWPDLDTGADAAIVSMPVGQHCARENTSQFVVLGPDTGEGAIRDEKGNIVATTRLVLYAQPSFV